jgi:DNA modification methylase
VGECLPDGKPKKKRRYIPPEIANPGNVIRTKNGGGHLGDRFAEKTEAPMNLEVAERFVLWYSPPGGIVLDPFCGSGTTGVAALKHGRRAVLCDERRGQISLARCRIATVKLG